MKTAHKKKLLGNIGVVLLAIWYVMMMATEFKLDYVHPSLNPVLAAWLFIASLAIALPGLVLTFIYKFRPAFNC
jgi:hypothetical protein